MPNWCNNTVTIKHEDSTKIDAIEVELSKDKPELFNSLVPRPANKEEDWYNWNVENWGTKWDASISHFIREDENTITVFMETAWAPPTKFYYALLEQYYNVDAYYHEEGMCFVGYFDDGNDYYYEYDLGVITTINEIPDNIVEWAGLREAHEDFIGENDE